MGTGYFVCPRSHLRSRSAAVRRGTGFLIPHGHLSYNNLLVPDRAKSLHRELAVSKYTNENQCNECSKPDTPRALYYYNTTQ